MQTKKPSKQIYALMILGVTAILCAVIFKYGSPFQKKAVATDGATTVNLVASETAISNVEAEDTDTDGLFDWEEALRGTDPQKGDTDNDGSSDNEEIQQGRDPLVAGPNDRTSEPTDNSLTASAEGEVDIADQPLTVSSELSKNLLTKLMQLKEDDQLTEANKTALIQELTNFTLGSFTYKQYEKTSLLLLENPTPEEIRVYASNVATLQVNIIASISNQGDAILNDILVLSNIYAAGAKNLSQLAVPKMLADIHLNIVNNYSVASRALEAFKDDTDPAKKTVSIGAYQKAVESQEQSLGIIAQYLEQNGILFTVDQIGDYWNNF